MNRLLKVAALTLVLVLGSLGQMVWASTANQPNSFPYPAGMVTRKMGLTMTAHEVTESQAQMGLAQGQATEVHGPAGDGQDDAYPGGDCDPARDQDRDCDGTCGGGDCDPAGDQDRDCDGTCGGGDCDPAGDQDRDCDGTCGGGDCDPAGDQDRDREAGHSGGQGGGGRH